ncbi:hypothetical protein SKAU_G00229520 [Synaphobranchus kaupii]|uniref:Uncharacterized protein n=1 Tax=Synaphobranchus kaupii TaxID=118154 RepID=A0A9Q1IT73_SYNKA|nr:hypothetical protein SKAU_G00229520 [Synaphobranchus kaupii]
MSLPRFPVALATESRANALHHGDPEVRVCEIRFWQQRERKTRRELRASRCRRRGVKAARDVPCGSLI